MSVKRGGEYEFLVEKAALGGMGLARVDGFAVFVPGTVPGDRVRVRIGRKKKQWAKARLLEILSPSPDRIEAPCPYADYCGGCTWQVLTYEKQLEIKREHVAEALEHIGGFEGVEVLPCLASEKIFGYRNKMEFSISDRRWLLPEELGEEAADRDFALGLHVPGTFDKVLDVDACLLQPDMGNEILRFAKQAMRESGLPAYGLKSHKGFWRFLVLRHSVAEDLWMVNLVTSDLARDVVEKLARDIRERFPRVAAVVNNVTDRKSGVAVGDYEVPLSGDERISDRIGPFNFNISANSFFQVNTRSAEILYNVISDYAGLTGAERVLDLYSGTGTIPLWLADRASEVMGIELVSVAVEDARENARRNQVANCRFQVGDIRDSLKELDYKPDLVITDPPRAGMHPKAVTAMADLAAPRIVAVSCNPATLARDLAMIRDQYEIKKVQPVDLFPHTPHVEAVALLEKHG